MSSSHRFYRLESPSLSRPRSTSPLFPPLRRRRAWMPSPFHCFLSSQLSLQPTSLHQSLRHSHPVQLEYRNLHSALPPTPPRPLLPSTQQLRHPDHRLRRSLAFFPPKIPSPSTRQHLDRPLPLLQWPLAALLSTRLQSSPALAPLPLLTTPPLPRNPPQQPSKRAPQPPTSLLPPNPRLPHPHDPPRRPVRLQPSPIMLLLLPR
jgi:hypothetical protein